MIDLEWFRTFSAIYECNNITEASKKLNMTQPGVSKHLSALESHIGKKLFERTTRKLTPTEYGKFLYSQINTPLQQLQKVEYYSSQRVKKTRLSITIGCTLDFFNKELIDKIYAFDMYIVTVFGTEKELVEALEQGKIQLLVGVKKHNLYNHQFSYFKSEALALVSSASINTPDDIRKSDVRLIQWIQKQTWFVYDNDQADIKKFWINNFNKNPKIVPRYILPSYLNIIEVLKTNEGFSVVPKQFCEKESKNGLIKIHFESTKMTDQDLFYSYKSSNNNSKEIDEFISKMKKNYADKDNFS
ncbi:LysR family transcriptional regulator [Flavobacteriaceae bacterium XHP0103]|uniref:LysR family transcriptional regulator n=1 Tax=Marixanthotalea marina TaxID=2844359 RepID=UPI002989A685|nr:LysR family transcriptional regulator [Marixanthotalea marina]MBU3821962.1 LysR family transcriptional regulator [Marixanthotalea marina]